MSRVEREEQYSPSSVLPGGDLAPFLTAYRDRSEAAHARYGPATVIRYGPRPANTVDLFVPTTPHRPALHLFIHGGYWQQLSKADSLFLAGPTLDRGVAFAALDYSLTRAGDPEITLDLIVAECRSALSQLRTDSESLGFDADRIVVSGSSAGAQLAAMCAGASTAGMVLASGVYELEPLIGTSINDAVGLSTEEARRNSPFLAADATLAAFPPTVIVWGETEPAEFRRQSVAFARRLAEVGVAVAAQEQPGRNHFNLAFDLAEGLDALDVCDP